MKELRGFGIVTYLCERFHLNLCNLLFIKIRIITQISKLQAMYPSHVSNQICQIWQMNLEKSLLRE